MEKFSNSISSGNSIITRYKDIQEIKVDPQVGLLCAMGAGRSIPLDTLLAQFKYAINHKIKDVSYANIRRELISITGEETIKLLEEMS